MKNLSKKFENLRIFSVALLFLICRSHPCVGSIMEIWSRDPIKNYAEWLEFETKFSRIYATSEMMLTLNASCNFLVYLMFSRQFRRQLSRTFTAIHIGVNRATRIVIVPLMHLHAVPRHPKFVSALTGDLSISITVTFQIVRFL